MSATEQFWAGEFGDEYAKRNATSDVGSIESNTALFERVLQKVARPHLHSAIEFGAGVGYNLEALHRILPGITLSAVELNERSANRIPCNVRSPVYIYQESVVNPAIKVYPHDLAFTKGLLIHVSPDELPSVYRNLYEASNRYVLVCEYYCPSPRMIPYRGHNDRLWARDFAGEMMRAHPLKLLDYGFVSKYDEHPQDDLSWFLMEKK